MTDRCPCLRKTRAGYYCAFADRYDVDPARCRAEYFGCGAYREFEALTMRLEGMGFRVLAEEGPVEKPEEEPAEYPVVKTIPIDKIVVPPDYPRLDVRPDESFVLDIAERGVTDPIVVEEMPDGRYELQKGYRRMWHGRKAGLREILAKVYGHGQLDEKAKFLMRMDDLFGEKPSGYEIAKQLKGALDRGTFRTQAELAEAIKKSERWVIYHLNMLKLEGKVNHGSLFRLPERSAREIMSRAPESEWPRLVEVAVGGGRKALLEELEKLEGKKPKEGEVVEEVERKIAREVVIERRKRKVPLREELRALREEVRTLKEFIEECRRERRCDRAEEFARRGAKRKEVATR